MRSVIALAAGLTLVSLAIPDPADATNRSNCRRLTRQIDHFEDVAQMAEDRDDDLWEASTRDHISRLEIQRAKRCPEYAEELKARGRAKKLAYEMGRAVKSAGKVFLQYLTFGAY
jgi:hypothetical protein